MADRGGRMDVPTIVTVARAAGVHTSTASRALSEDPTVRAAVALATRDRVRAAADRLGYRRSRAGVTLRTGRTGVLGVLVPRITDIVVALAYEGLDEVARAHGYVSIVVNTLDDPTARLGQIRTLREHGVDAILYSDAHLEDVAPLEGTHGVPVLPFLRSAGQRHGPTVDDASGGSQIARHLLDLGHERIAVVAGPSYASTAQDRVAGFLHELARSGVRVAEQDCVASTFDVFGGKVAATRLLRSGRPPSAIFAVNDFTAIGVMAAARDHGLSVPEDIAVAGFNDIPLAGELPIPLTTVRSPLREVGAVAARMTLRTLHGDPPELPDPLAVTLVARGTTAPAR